VRLASLQERSVSPEQPERIECRPLRSNWILALACWGVGAVMSALPWTTPSPRLPSQWLAAWGLAALFFLVGMGLALWLLRARIVADREGLRWRGMGHWRRVRWEEVSDYYDQYPPGGRSVVENSVGKLFPSQEMTGLPELRLLIKKHATHARARGWGMLGARPEDEWPREFHYRTRDNALLPYLFWSFLVVWLGILGFLVSSGLRAFLEMPGSHGWAVALASCLLVLPLTAPPALVLWAFTSSLKAAREHVDEQITASPEGVAYEDGSRRVAASWDQVRSYSMEILPGRLTTYRFVVSTENGTFHFFQTIKNLALLKEIIRRYSTSAQETDWHADDEEVIGGEASLWSTGVPGQGDRIFHYRTRANRILLWLLGGLALSSAVVTGATLAGFMTYKDPLLPLIFAVISGAVLGWARWCYQTASILISGEVITQQGPFGERSIPWEQVEEYRRSGIDALGIRAIDVVGGSSPSGSGPTSPLRRS
jgi:hypothetical protein